MRLKTKTMSQLFCSPPALVTRVSVLKSGAFPSVSPAPDSPAAHATPANSERLV